MSPNAPMDDLLDEPRRDRRRSGRCRVGGTHPGGQPTTAHTYTPLTMKGHAFTAYLRIYQPLAAFPPRERAEWAAYVEAGQVLPASLLVGREERRGLARALGLTVGAEREHALVERVGDVVFLCPLRTELRTLQSLVAFRSSVPGGRHPPGADGRRRDGRGRRGAAGLAPQLRPRQPGPARLRRTNQSNPVRGPGRRPLGRRGVGGPWRPRS